MSCLQRTALFCGLSGRPKRCAPIRRRVTVVSTPRQIFRRRCARNCSITTLSGLGNYIPLDRDVFMRYYYAYVYVRIMQALGAYGFRGFYERKAHFLQSVPYALKNVRWLMDHVELPIELPTLHDAFFKMLDSENLRSLAEQPNAETASDTTAQPDPLIVRIFSFSFHRGGPKDETGNGGGFVFDCRSVPNPGREERFKALTGKDASVIEYLNQQQSAHEFFARATSLVDASVRTYQLRGFKNVMVSFGCTGGQHRSVYFAEQLAKHLNGTKNVQVILRHVELEKMSQ